MRKIIFDDKLFDNWNQEKKEIHQYGAVKNYQNIQLYEWEIWYIKLWTNIWFKQNGKWWYKRPVLILKRVWNMFLCAIMTTKGKIWSLFYHKIQSWNLNKDSYIILSQIRSIDKKRFIEKIWKVSKKEFEEIKKLLKNLIFPEDV